MEIYFYFFGPVFIVICFVCFRRYLFNGFTNSKAEAELKSDKARADQLATSINKQSERLTDCKEKSNRITEHQQRITERINEATRAIAEAKGRSKESINLIDECLAILEEAESKK